MPATTAAEHEARLIGATARLAFTRRQHPDLKTAEAQARLRLAAAVMAMDEAFESGPAIAEQLAVEEAKNEYAQALADLVRGQAHSSI